MRLQLNQKFNGLPDSFAQRVNLLNLKPLERLALALLNFTTIEDLETWLDLPENQPKPKTKKGNRPAEESNGSDQEPGI